MEDVDCARPSEYEHRIVSRESSECECGMTHEDGDAIWGGRMPPSAINGYDPLETVERLHSVEVEYDTSVQE